MKSSGEQVARTSLSSLGQPSTEKRHPLQLVAHFGSSSKALRAPIAMESSWRRRLQSATGAKWKAEPRGDVLWRSIRSNGPSGRAVARLGLVLSTHVALLAAKLRRA